MSLKKCMGKAGKFMDSGDKKFIDKQLESGKTDEEALAALEQRITIEQDELVQALKKKGIEVKYPKVDKAAPKKSSTKEQSEPKTKNPAIGILEELAGESEIITKFLEGKNNKVKMGIGNAFIANEDTVTITGTDIGRGAGDKLDMSKPADRKLQRELIEHEIIHANTVAIIARALNSKKDTQEKREIQYFDKAISSLKDIYPSLIDSKGMPDKTLTGETMERIKYIIGQDDEATRIAEFVSIMSTEPETAADIYKLLSNKNPDLLDRIKAFIKKVKTVYLGITGSDLERDIDIEKLYGALSSVIETGTTMREQNYAETKRLLSKFEEKFGAGETKSDPGKLNYLNYAVATMLNSRLERAGKRLSGNLHRILKDRFPLYVDVSNKIAGIYDDSEALQQLMHTITGNGTDKTKKANILAQYAKVMSQQMAVINEQSGKFKTLLAPLSEKERATIGRFVTDMPLHDYFVLAKDFKTASEIEAKAVRLEAELKALAPKTVAEINSLIDWNIHGKETPGVKIFNLEAGSTQMNGEFGEKARKLLALKSIKTLGAQDFESFLENTDLANLIKDQVIANRLALMENNGSGELKDSLVMDYYKEDFQIDAVDLAQLKNFTNGDSAGWKVLKMPTSTELGIVYKPTIDSTHITGAFTDIKLNSQGITVDKKRARYPGVAKTKDGYKLRLTKEEKLKLGLVEDFTQGLVRGTAHNMAIMDSQIIRDELLRKETRMEIGKNTSKLEDIIDADNVDNPWFIKLDEDTVYEQLPAKIRAKYMKIGDRASNVNGFNENVDLVRKDISHWLMGGSTSSLFQNPQMKWVMRIVKDLVAGSKIGMVVLNPIKIANDNISNVSYLGVMGVSPLFIAKNFKNITRDFQEYTDLQRQIVQLKVQLVANPESESLKKKIKALRKRTEANSLGNIMDKGFVNSLGSDLVAKNADTLSGLQADMHTAIEYLLKNKEGKRNYLGHFISQLHNVGGNGEDFLKYIGGLARKTGKTGKGADASLDQVYERLKEIRTEDDVVNYVAQYTTSPGSEAVRMGASITDLTDVLAKETYYRHLVEIEGYSPEKARITVLDSFPDYKENMPLAVRQLSDVGIIMFPSFWLRIQKAIYRMVRDKPVNFATELMLQEAFDSDVNTIFDANIINKSESFGGLFHMPMESAGVNSIIPMHLW